jgi:hypothetical protein
LVVLGYAGGLIGRDLGRFFTNDGDGQSLVFATAASALMTPVVLALGMLPFFGFERALNTALLGIGTYLLGLLVGAVCLATLHGISRSRRARA